MDLHPGEESFSFDLKPTELDPVRRTFHENKDWYLDLIEHSHDLLCLHDLEGRLLSVNQASARRLGYDPEEILNIPMQELIAPEYRDQFDAYLRQIEREGAARGLLAVMTRSGERRIWEYSNTLRREGTAKPIVSGIARDVTEQKRAEKVARETSELNRQIIASASEGIAVYDRNLRCMVWNPFMEQMTGISAAMAVGAPFDQLVPPEVRGHDPETELKRALLGHTITVPDEELPTKAGMRWVSSRKAPLRNAQGEITGVIVILHDITERKQVEAKLRLSESRYRTLHEGSPVGVCWIDTKTGRYLGVNPKYCEIVGRTEEDLLGRDFQSLTHPDDLAISLEKLRQLMAGEARHYEIEKRYVRPDGSVRWIEVKVVAMWPEGENPICHMRTVEDITERKLAEEALRASEERERARATELQTILDTLPIPVLIARDPQCLRIDANRAGARHLGVPLGSNVSLSALAGQKAPFHFERDGVVIPPKELPLQRTVEAKAPVQDVPIKLVLEDGTEKYELGNAAPLLDENGRVRGAVAAAVDITERVQAEQALRQITEELRQAKEKLAEEKLYLEEAIDAELGFGEIIGRSSGLRQVMEKTAKVAPSDTTVLLLGETGTGKELIARVLHHRSKRQGKSFIKVNCAAIPSGLLESELFGHEKGAFTGAVARKLGRFELADGGTLFLDEIGEIPLSLQPKLLRVLQDMEFERLGGTQTLKVNFRLLAATNRDLAQAIKANEFRSDLYYRLNVFPILIPPLRERRDDIRPLVEHFVRKFAIQMKKTITSIPSKTMELLVRWRWPGNIRELENFVERSVILTSGSVLRAPLAELEGNVEVDDGSLTLHEIDRERIIKALRHCHGKLGGAGGAAALLGLKRTTLQSKLDHLGIKPRTYR
ncbi:MAG TPA: PAS domain S-box protein [Candidatus Aquilonibacter sp.]|nr:PAS domain S-box protein [Candidatus Aquilonibacter sp.]